MENIHVKEKKIESLVDYPFIGFEISSSDGSFIWFFFFAASLSTRAELSVFEWTCRK